MLPPLMPLLAAWPELVPILLLPFVVGVVAAAVVEQRRLLPLLQPQHQVIKYLRLRLRPETGLTKPCFGTAEASKLFATMDCHRCYPTLTMVMVFASLSAPLDAGLGEIEPILSTSISLGSFLNVPFVAS